MSKRIRVQAGSKAYKRWKNTKGDLMGWEGHTYVGRHIRTDWDLLKSNKNPYDCSHVVKKEMPMQGLNAFVEYCRKNAKPGNDFWEICDLSVKCENVVGRNDGSYVIYRTMLRDKVAAMRFPAFLIIAEVYLDIHGEEHQQPTVYDVVDTTWENDYGGEEVDEKEVVASSRYVADS